jgi:threonine synthase
MGLPGLSFLAATNENDVVPRYLEWGTYGPRPSMRTLSTAMDVGAPSNLQRILHLYGGDLEALRNDVVGRRVTDGETQECIRRVAEAHGYVLDPHTAVGFSALESELESRPDAVGLVLATAHPAKFAEVVEPILGEELPIPEALARYMERPRETIPLAPELDQLRRVLGNLP